MAHSYVNLPEGTFTHYTSTTITGNYQATRTMFVRHELNINEPTKLPDLLKIGYPGICWFIIIFPFLNLAIWEYTPFSDTPK